MALTPDQAGSIADSAVALYEALQERGVDEELAGDWVQGSMMTLVMHEVEESEPGADAAGPYEQRDSYPPLVTPRGGPGYPDEDRQQRQAREIHGVYGRTLEDPGDGLQGPPP